jgi:hypothetical protein
MEMPNNNSVIRINQWSLNFLPYLSINKEAYTNYNTIIPIEIDNTNYNDVLPIFFTSILAISILFYYKKLLK